MGQGKGGDVAKMYRPRCNAGCSEPPPLHAPPIPKAIKIKL